MFEFAVGIINIVLLIAILAAFIDLKKRNRKALFSLETRIAKISKIVSKMEKELARDGSGKVYSEGLKRQRKQAQEFLLMTLNKKIWPQIESLIALYRIYDEKAFLPATRNAKVSPDILLHIISHIRLSRPRHIVECGCGTSTIAMALALQSFAIDGHIYSLEDNADYAERVRCELKMRGLDQYVSIIDAPLVAGDYEEIERSVRWYDLDEAFLPDEIDFLLIDGPQGSLQRFSRLPVGRRLFPRMSSRGYALLDDASREDEAALPDIWREEFPGLLVQWVNSEKGAVGLSFSPSGRISE